MRFLLFQLVITVLFSTNAFTQAFVTTWQVDNDGDQITIPTTGTGYDYNVDWGDGDDDINLSGNISHTYAVAGTYTVTITGQFPRIYFNAGVSRNQILSIEQWGSQVWTSMANAFRGCSNLVINAPDMPNLTGVTDMSGMFRGASSLNQSLAGWNTSNVTDMSFLFSGASSFDQPLDSWDVSNVENMQSMFQNASVFNQPLASWDVRKVTTMQSMFQNASDFNGDISTWQPESVTSMRLMFRVASDFDQPIGGWNTSNVTDMRQMFDFAQSFNQALDGWDVSKVTDMYRMFASAVEFNQNINNWEVGEVTNMSQMFNFALVFNQPLDNWDVSKVTNMSGMFNITNEFNQNIDAWETISVTNMSSMFNSARVFNSPLDSWNVENVTDMSSMFRDANLFNQPLDSWNVSNVTDMGNMFQNTSFNQELNSWDVSNVTDMSFMFASSGFNGDISAWTPVSVTTMRSMFSLNDVFNRDIGEWDVSNVTNMSGMFNSADAFNQDISEWNVENVVNMGDMFTRATTFNQDISDWNTASLQFAFRTFRGATAFNYQLGDWDVSNAINLSNMLDDSGLSVENYDSTLIGWNGLPSLPSGLSFSAEGLSYCTAETARNNIISTYSWTINDAGINCPAAEIAVYDGASNSDPEIFDAQTAAIDFGNQVAGSTITRTFAIENQGGVDLTISNISVTGTAFSISSLPSTLISSGAVETFTIDQFSSTDGTFTETVTIESDDADEASFTFPVTVVVTLNPEPEIVLLEGADSTQILSGQTDAIDFGATEADTDNILQFIIANIGNEDLSINDISFSGSAFSLVSTAPSFVNIADSVAFEVNFRSSTVGTYTETITILNDDTNEGTFTFTLTGEIVPPPSAEIAVFLGSSSGPEIINNQTTAIDLGTIFQGDNLTQTFNLQNSGNADLVVSDITFSEDNFALLSSLPIITVVDGSVEVIFEIALNQSSLGFFNDTITITSNDPDDTNFSFPITAEIVSLPEPEIEVYFDSSTGGEIFDEQTNVINLGQVIEGDNFTQSFNIQNAGDADLVIDDIFLSEGTFSVLTALPITVNSSNAAGMQFDIELSETVVGVYSDTVTIVNNDSDEQDFTFPIFVEIIPSPAPEILVYLGASTDTEITNGQTTAIDLGTISEGDNLTQSFNIQNAGNTDLVISDITFSEGNYALITSLPLTVTAGNTSGVVFEISLSETTEGIYTDTVKILSNDLVNADFSFPISAEVIAAVNTPPIISSINDITINEDESSGILNFTVNDTESNLADLTITASSDNPSVIINNDIELSGTDTNRSIEITPLPDSSGIAQLTIQVTEPDGTFATTSFNVTVEAVNDAPVITGQVALSTPQNTSITLNLDDLVVSDIDSDFPNGFSLNVLPGENYSISQNTITPATDYTGLLTVPIVVNDGEENSPEVEIEITVEAISIGVVIGDSAIANGSTVVFDEVLLGDFDARDLQINNSGTIPLTILAIQIDNNDFSVRDELPAPIPPGESANIAIEFMPTSLGEQSATLTIVSENTTDFVINLSARGIEKAPKVEVFNVVTPLNDGKHDYLKVQNIEFYESNSVVIYNRWGQQVYAVNDYDNLDNNFKGISSKGDQLDSGTYYYVIDLSGSETVKGFFVLQR
ncbi:hypothetical protein GCM10027429_21040 [Marivirga atlantica]|uniref:BspA family leucine-rich repeat surface protein n=1 Tax=Marivirga atlantica TaxID=1548457 RepID=A0A937AFE0_9BACT|nr:BspA family leucine-rich repeat surface protein [Marivirga atlantica]MBL0765721.1 BspA family leucine-rich repeat surface protein [Marivirga atlantica]